MHRTTERRYDEHAAVEALYRGFIERFGETECRSLTGCDWSKEEDIARFQQENVFERHCCRQLEYVLGVCLDVARAFKPGRGVGA